MGVGAGVGVGVGTIVWVGNGGVGEGVWIGVSDGVGIGVGTGAAAASPAWRSTGAANAPPMRYLTNCRRDGWTLSRPSSASGTSLIVAPFLQNCLRVRVHAVMPYRETPSLARRADAGV